MYAIMSTSYAQFVFGIYPGGEAGSDSGMAWGLPDDPDKILHCLRELQGGTCPFIVRGYERFSDRGAPSRWAAQAPRNYEQYLGEGRKLDLVLMCQSASGDVWGFVDFARQLVERRREHLYCVQVTEEASFKNGPDAIDGAFPRVEEALVAGVLATKEALLRAGRPDILVGFNSTPTFGPHAAFWPRLRELGGQAFADAVDYVGVDFFPDVFRRAAPDGEPESLEESARMVLAAFRNQWLPQAGLGASVPLHIAEHGWATAPDRSYARQADVIERIVRLVWRERQRLNIARYTLFALRDAESASEEHAGNIFYHFGITRDDYTPKPAYETYRRLIAELGVRQPAL